MMGAAESWCNLNTALARPFLAVLALASVTCAQSDPQPLCGDTQSWNSTTLPYSFSNNAWGNDGSGSSCLQVIDGGSSFQVTYKWSNNYYDVHGYPHLKLEDNRLPANISEIATLKFRGQWITYVEGTENNSEADQAQALSRARVRSNVAIDMFLDTTPDLATQFRPSYEVMIWFWSIKGIDPVGTPANDNNGNQMQYDIAGVRFYLYSGTNDHGQHVFSWLSDNQINSTDADYYPLLQYLWQFNLVSPDLYLGSIDFGTETFYAATTTFFSASQYNLSISTMSDSDDTAPPPLQTPSPIPRSQASTRWKVPWGLSLASCTLVLLVLGLG